MNKSMFKYLMAGLLFAGLSSQAVAESVEFNLDHSDFGVPSARTYDSVSTINSGISMTVSAYAVSNDGAGNILPGSVLLNSPGGVWVGSSHQLGVRSRSGEATYLDGASGSGVIVPGSTRSDLAPDVDEGLLFSFDRVVTLDFIDFNYWATTSGDDFNLAVDGVNILTNINSATSISSSLVSNVLGEEQEFTFSGVSGTNFMIWADDDLDKFRIDRLRVSANVSAVPEPSIIALMGLGLAGIGFAARRRRQP